MVAQRSGKTTTAAAVADPVPVTRLSSSTNCRDTVAAYERSGPDHLPPPQSTSATRISTQAGSFTNDEDAQRLRASLSLLGLNCATAAIDVSTARFATGSSSALCVGRGAQRAMTRLRDQNIDALVLAR
jgi:cell division protein FtsN